MWVAIVGLLGLGGVVAWLGSVIWEWILRPWRLIQACRKQGIPGYGVKPFFGQIPEISEALEDAENNSPHTWASLDSARNSVENYGKVFYFSAGKTVRLCITDPDLVKEVLAGNADCYEKPSYIQVLKILGGGLLSASGDVWARQRKLLGLAFHNKEIKSEVGLITKCAIAATERWLLEMQSGAIELPMYRKFLEITLDIIGNLAFGGTEIGGNSRISPLITKAFDRYLLNSRALVFGSAASVPGYKFLPTRLNREIAEDKSLLTSVVEKLIIDRANARALLPRTARTQKDFLDLLITAVGKKNSHGITSKQLRGNGITFLLAGHETTASLLTWTVYMLAVHPLWQERARAEVEEFCEDGVVEWACLVRLKTLTMILHETLRLFPPVPLIGRMCVKENQIGSLKIPNGLEILIPTVILHRSKDLWGLNADDFEPMRFANGINGACKHSLGFLPFGSGPRTCVGQSLAIAEARAVLAILLPRFSWKLSPGYRHHPDVSLTLQPKYDLPLILETLK